MLGFGIDMGIDLGTASVLVYVRHKGVVLNEPSVVAIDRNSGRVIAVGGEAQRMLGRTPGNIIAARPLRDGVIADYDTTERMLRYFIYSACGGRPIRRPRLVICIPAGVTSVEERAVRQAAVAGGAREAYLIEEPLAAALGAGIDISRPSGSAVVDIGGGTTDIAVLSLGGIVLSKSLRVAGDKFDEAIVRHFRHKHNLLIGERTAEEVKKQVGTAYSSRNCDKIVEVRGRDLVRGLPKTVAAVAAEVQEALEEPLEAIVTGVRDVLEKIPPELAADIVERGIVLTGGGALLAGMDRVLARATGLMAFVADDPVSCVALGTGKALSMLHVLRKSSVLRA